MFRKPAKNDGIGRAPQAKGATRETFQKVPIADLIGFSAIRP